MLSLAHLPTELDARNVDNVARTASYLELYALARERGRELPWLLMAHVVSRNAGYLMTDLAVTLSGSGTMFTPEALTELFLFLERANYLIFFDAWHHVLQHLLGRAEAADPRTPRFMREAWSRHEERARARHGDRDDERALVLDLVTNEQNLIENRVVHHPRFERARAMIGFLEAVGREAPIVLPPCGAKLPAIKVGGFARKERRIDAGRRIFDELLGDRARREEIFAWAMAHPHTGARSVYEPARRGRDATLRERWPTAKVRALWAGVHASPEPDPAWP